MWQRLDHDSWPPWATRTIKITDAWSYGRYVLVYYEGTRWTLYLDNLYLGTSYDVETPEEATMWADMTIEKCKAQNAAKPLAYQVRRNRDFTLIKVKHAAV
jgi:hypothetical protein